MNAPSVIMTTPAKTPEPTQPLGLLAARGHGSQRAGRFLVSVRLVYRNITQSG